ncbi:hypothetical protein [Siccirubricoccus sp. G192]|uniref:hypothetical protein n=1 Tax=Siccirubricoccus sp. G192 TaxID=2849651 RepID=UPI001C2C31EC|nr:hypothetical protein [Siccirubricoccus sp. G192]MBV1796825.1 hypothetical protein [Siccirubricoccus sp. G192]
MRGEPGAGGSVLLRLDSLGRLLFGATTRQMLNLWREGYGIGVQASTLYFRSDFDFAWHRGGTHVDAQGQPGAGGTQLLLLDREGRLSFGTQTQQMLNLWGDAYGTGVQDFTLYQRSGADFCWFRGGAHSNARGDAGGGLRAMRLDATGLTVAGDIGASGDVLAGGQRIPLVDVQTGVITLNVTPGPGNTTSTGLHVFDVTSALGSYGNVSLMVALAEISNVSTATGARWRVQPEGVPQRLAANRARFQVRWQVDDTDGMLNRFSWIAIFTA